MFKASVFSSHDKYFALKGDNLTVSLWGGGAVFCKKIRIVYSHYATSYMYGHVQVNAFW